MSWLLYDDKALALSGTKKIVVGRGHDCQLVVLDCLASRRHATVVLRDGAVSIIDNGSRNGTIVNGSRVAGMRTLEDRDRIIVGSSEIVFSTRPPAKGAQEITPGAFVPATDEDQVSTVTATGTGMMLLNALFVKAIENNEMEQAQKIIANLSERTARAASSGTLTRAELVPVTEMVLRFAGEISDVRWVEWLLRVHTKLKFFPAPHAAKRMRNLGMELQLSDPSAVDLWVSAVHGRVTTEAQKLARKHLVELAKFADSTQA